MTTILIPTDFKASALDCVPALCQRFSGEQLTLVFVHLFKLSDSETDLLMLSRRSKEHEYVSDEFYSRCIDVKSSNAAVSGIKIEFFYGSTLSLFRNFLEGYGVSYILHTDNCSLSPLNRSSINPDQLIHRCGLPVVHIGTMAPVAEEETEMVIGEVAPVLAEV